MKPLRSLLCFTSLLAASSLALAHPGHGLGSLGHALDHAGWNFFAFVLGATALLLIARVPVKSQAEDKSHDQD